MAENVADNFFTNFSGKIWWPFWNSEIKFYNVFLNIEMIVIEREIHLESIKGYVFASNAFYFEILEYF